MAYDPESIRWASVAYNLPENGLPNTSDRPAEFKNTGLKVNQPLPLQWLNGQFNDLHKALVDTQSQLDAIVGGSSQPTLEAIYPIDSLYISFNANSPATVLGFGTWVKIEGRALVGVDLGQTEFNSVGKLGGSKDHTHTDNFTIDNHILTEAEMPNHSHDISIENTRGTGTAGAGDGSSSFSDKSTSTTGGDSGHNHGISGGVQSTSNLMPYMTVFMYRRTA